MDSADLENRFTYHRPTPEKVTKHENIRAWGKELAAKLNDILPEGREKALTITHLEEVVMWANASLAREA
jgi:hypothetical protein